MKCYNFLLVQRRYNCSPAASFTKWIMTLYLLKEDLQTFIFKPGTQKFQILSCHTFVANERYVINYVNYFIFNIMATVLITSVYKISISYISKIQNSVLNISHILVWNSTLEHCFGHSIICISNLVLAFNNKIVCSTIICFNKEEQEI
jgi:hypothetical protein